MNSRSGIIFCSAGLLLGLLAGCARDRYVLTDRSGVTAPQPPPILTTPAVYLLTNNAGFVANLRLEEQRGTSAGRLIARGPKLFYAPEEKKQASKYVPSGGFSFIWDAEQGKGYVLSEALQGYAPISHTGAGTVTNVTIESTPTARSASAVVLTAQLSNGTVAKYECNPGPAGGGPPQRIIGGPPPFNAIFEKARLEAPPAEVFGVPNGFTAYSSAEAMVDEISVRYRNLKRKIY
jgi:hypothetical protein